MTLNILPQSILGDEEDKKSEFSLTLPQLSLPQNLSNFASSINQDEYIVDAGDVFTIKIDIPGPAVKIFPATVTSDGNILLPDAPSVYVKDLNLNEAKSKILNSIRKANIDSRIEIFLQQIHPITVTVLGALETDVQQQLTSASRLFDAVQNVISISKHNELVTRESLTVTDNYNSPTNNSPEDARSIDEKIALRKVELIRKGVSKEYDLLKFRTKGDNTYNPYLMDKDIVIIPYKGVYEHQISVEGATGKDTEFEYLYGDKLSDAIEFAGGLETSADSANIDIYRFKEDNVSIERLTASSQNAENFILKPNDRIYVRYKPFYHPKFTVEIQGQVKYPGTYAIEEGKTTLREVLQKAGGISGKAALRNAKIIRSKFQLEDKELNRLRRMTVEEMNELERNYFRLRTREDLRIVVTDFENLLSDSNSFESSSVYLRDQDIIIIPAEQKLVFVSGGVLFPGNVVYNESMIANDYIDLAGGFNSRARKNDVKVIKSKTGTWLDMDSKSSIEEGDIIFVPEKVDRDWWAVFKESLLILTQFATIAVVINNL